MIDEKDSIIKRILQFCIQMIVNLFLLFLLVEGFEASYYFSYKLFADVPYRVGAEQRISITIEEGSTATLVAQQLEQSGVVEGKYLFLARTYLGKYNKRILAGTYQLGPDMTPDEICRAICGIQSEDAS